MKLLTTTTTTLQTVNSSAFSGLKHVKFLFLPAGVRNLESDAFNGLEVIDKLKLEYLVKPCSHILFTNAIHLHFQCTYIGSLNKRNFKNSTDRRKCKCVRACV